MTTDRNQSSSDKYEKKHLNQSKANCELRSSLLRPRLPSVMAAAAAVSVLFGVGVTADEGRNEEPIPPWGNYCFWAELLCPFPPSPSFPLLFSSSFKSSGRIGRWIDPKVQLGIFQVQSTRLKVGPRSHAMFCPGPSHSQHQLMSRLLHFSKLISTLSTLKVL